MKTVNVRHNGFGVDVVGLFEDVDHAMSALNMHHRLVAALREARDKLDVGQASAGDDYTHMLLLDAYHAAGRVLEEVELH
jgi:hypothetical protein